MNIRSKPRRLLESHAASVLPVMLPELAVMSQRPVLVARYSPWALKLPFSANQAIGPASERGIS